jgi:hypothetical protein
VIQQTGWRYVTAVSSPAALGGVTNWANSARITASDNSRASVTTAGTAIITTRFVRGAGFGFDATMIPPGARILGVELQIEGLCSLAGTYFDSSVHLVARAAGDATDRVSTIDHASAQAWPTAESFRTFGAIDDTWGAPLTTDVIFSPAFGFDYQAVARPTADTQRTMNIDSARMRITFEPRVRRHAVRWCATF